MSRPSSWPVESRPAARAVGPTAGLSIRQPSDVRARGSSGADVASIVAQVRRNLLPLIVSLAAALSAGVAYLVLAKPQYTAQGAIFIEPRQRRVVSEDLNQPAITDISLFESQVAILGSDTVLRRVAEALRLDQDPEFAPPRGRGPLTQLRERFSGPRPVAEPMERSIEELAKRLRIRRAQNTYVVSVDATSEVPGKAAAIANAILQAYLDDQARAKGDAAAKANALIDGRLDEIKIQVRNAETKVDAFRRANSIVTSEGGLLNEQQLTRLNTELVAVRGLVAATKARFDEMTATLRRGVSPEALPEAMSSPVVQRLREQHASALRREAALSSQLQPRHPLMADARAQVASSRRQIDAELERVATQAQNEYQIATAREREIQAKISELEREVASTTTAQIRLRELEREADAGREVLRTFLARAKETQEQQNLSIADARIITPASLPGSPSSPNPLVVLALSGFAGLGLAGLYALLTWPAAGPSMAPSRVSRARVAAVQTAITHLGNIPHLAVRGRLLRPFAREQGTGLPDVMTALTDGARNDEVAFREAVSTFARQLRSAGDGAASDVILLVSRERGAGATTAAFALSYAEALSGRRVLLVDAASADPRLSSEFAGDLAQDHPCVLDSKEHLLEITARDPRSGLVFLPIALADLRALSSTQLQRLSIGLARVAADFDVVIIDGGALAEDSAIAGIAGIAAQVVSVAPAKTAVDLPPDEIAETLAVPASRIAGRVLVDV